MFEKTMVKISMNRDVADVLKKILEVEGLNLDEDTIMSAILHQHCSVSATHAMQIKSLFDGSWNFRRTVVAVIDQYYDHHHPEVERLVSLIAWLERHLEGIPLSSTGEITFSTGVTHRVKKQRSYRAIPLTEKLLEELDRHLRWQKKDQQDNHYTTNLMFSTSYGTYYYRRNIRRSLERTCRRNNLPRHKFHSFRATFTTNLCAEGVPIEVAKNLLGHKSIETTLTYYVRIDELRCRDAVEKIQEYSLS